MNPPNRSLIYRVSRSGHVIGEYDIDRIVELLDSGEFLWTDLCWAQGMAAWAPLSNLRAEVAAVKAFPASAAMPTPVASGRRRMQAPTAQMAAPQTKAPSVAGWVWIVGGVTLGALVGLLTTHLFPNVVTVDRPVEKIVEKPIEVIRTVEKRVEIPAALTSEQMEAVSFHQRLQDIKSHKSGPRLLKVSKSVKVLVNITGEGAFSVSSSLVATKVENAFRNQGFKILTADSEEILYNSVVVRGRLLKTELASESVIVSGEYAVEIRQFVTYINPFDDMSNTNMTIKSEELTLWEYSGAFIYGRTNFRLIPDAYETAAQQAANELRKAYDN